MTAAIARLEQEGLSAEALAYLNKLPADQRQQLAEQLVTSMEAKDERVEQATSRALDVVPAPLRRAVRKILFA